MRKFLLYIAVYLGLQCHLMAQQTPMLNHYTLMPVLINPAYTGFEGTHNVFVNHQSRWAGFEGAPRNFTLNYNGGFGKSIGLGGQITSETIGAQQNISAGFAYAYRFYTEDLKMSIGLSTDIRNHSLRASALTNPLLHPGDLLIQEAADGILRFDAGLGFFGMYQDKFFFGASMPSMLNARLDEASPEVGYIAENNFFSQFILQVGGVLYFDDMQSKLMPSLVARSLLNAPFAVDLNLVGSFIQDQLFAGMSYRLGGGNGLGILVGAGFEKFSIYYSYDVSFLGFQQYSNGTHEVTVGLVFGKEKRKYQPKTTLYKSIDEL
jgi:type IX secretion system PorP/SprF family membrane protein